MNVQHILYFETRIIDNCQSCKREKHHGSHLNNAKDVLDFHSFFHFTEDSQKRKAKIFCELTLFLTCFVISQVILSW